MSTSRQSSSKKFGQRFANAKRLVHVNPDGLAVNLLRWRKHLTSHAQRREMWRLLQTLGGDAVVRRAGDTIRKSKSIEELEAVLNAASADLWYETGGAIKERFQREVQRASNMHGTLPRTLEALANAAAALRVELHTEDIPALLKHSSSRLRALGAKFVELL